MVLAQPLRTSQNVDPCTRSQNLPEATHVLYLSSPTGCQHASSPCSLVVSVPLHGYLDRKLVPPPPCEWLLRACHAGGGSPHEVTISSNLILQGKCLRFRYVLLATEPTMVTMWEGLHMVMSARRQGRWRTTWGLSTGLLKRWIIKFETLLIKLDIAITLHPASFSTRRLLQHASFLASQCSVYKLSSM